MTDGSPIRAIAVDSFLFIPPLYVFDGLSAKRNKFNFSIAQSTTFENTYKNYINAATNTNTNNDISKNNIPA